MMREKKNRKNGEEKKRNNINEVKKKDQRYAYLYILIVSLTGNDESDERMR